MSAALCRQFGIHLVYGKKSNHALSTIVNKDAFEGWLVSTFRNYLINRSNAEEQLYELSEHNLKADEDGEGNQEQLINKAAQLIAYSHQVFLP